ncbi:MAG: hypothetical protein V3T88_07550 [Nitrosomonadaceae bacterium]
MIKVDNRKFDFFLGAKEFTTKSLNHADREITDLFFVDGELIAKQECKHGEIEYFIREQNA